MNLNKRELVQHVEYEPETYYASFSAELEISLSPMWSLLAHCRTEVRCVRLRKVLLSACKSRGNRSDIMPWIQK